MGTIYDLLVPPVLDRPVLLRSGTEVVARLTLVDRDQPWLHFHFQPLPAWTVLGARTDSLYGGVRDGLAGIESRVRAIENLDLVLQSEDGAIEVRDFLIHLRGERALVRSYPRGTMP